jgi:hypothetical protein
VKRFCSSGSLPRFARLALVVVGLGSLLACGEGVPHPIARGPEASASAPSGTDASAIAAGYAERLRLGLGSPFRLIDFALADPRLEPEQRRAVALDLLSRTYRGDSYEVDPAALLPTLEAPRPEELAWARGHLLVIDGTIADASDPRVGELAVRLAYQLSRLESTVDPRTLSAAVGIAGLRRDRELAMQDARRLVAAARVAGVDPIDLVAQWRREQRFGVEQPVLQVTAPRLEQQAIARAPYLLRAIRHAWLARPQPAGTPAHGALPELQRLQAIADSMDMPPRAAVVVALRRTTGLLPASLSDAQRSAWERFAEIATDEEKLAAHAAALVESEPALRTALARAQVRAAVGTRTFAQERVWYPDMEAPTAAHLRASYGVHIRVGKDVPERWVPFVLSGLEESLVDLRSVVPDLSVRGLEVEISREPRISTSLASHSPQTRVLQWPVMTGPGTLAHEIAHDLDWQAGRRLSWIGRQYASEQALLRSPNAFGAALATLTPDVSPSPNAPRDNIDHATRPAEVIARTFDWFVVTRLAARGRWNGTLSSAQDDLITGHGSLGPPGTSDAYGAAVIEALRPLVTIPLEERRAFLSEYGPVRWPQATLVLRSAVGRLEPLEAPILPGPAALLPMQPVRAVSRARDEVLRELDVRYCTSRAPLVGFDIDAAYRGVVVQTAAARGRAIAVSLAEQIAGGEGVRWMRRELYGPLWPAAQVEFQDVVALSAIAAEVRTLEEMPPQLVRSGFDLGSPLSSCRLAAPQR